ncbi:MAG: P-loop NTPase [Chloroflexi bacterium]|nr:P-loop NTPase [Chloroflexota bacterium]
MSQLISLHSFRRGVGKTTLTVNLAVLLTQAGFRVGMADLNFSAPSLHIFLGIDESAIPHTINDFIWGDCEIVDCALEVTSCVEEAGLGQLFLTAASTRPSHITRIVRGGFYTHLISDACQGMVEELNLDFLLVDTQAGWNEESQLITAVSDTSLIILRPDQQDYQGTGLLTELARQLDVPQRFLIVNQTPPQFELTTIQHQFSDIYQCDLTAVLPHSQTLMWLGSSGLFVLEYPDDAVTGLIKNLVWELRTN